jgi:hypothetical protein
MKEVKLPFLEHIGAVIEDLEFSSVWDCLKIKVVILQPAKNFIF